LNNTEKLLIEILSAFVNGRAPKITTEYDAKKLYDLAKAQSVSGIVGYMLHKYGIEDIISGDKRFALTFNKIVTQLVRSEVYACKLLKKLSREQIPHIIFKGLVVKDCYPVPELRTYGDVDLIIRKEHIEKTHKLMCNSGYEWKLMDGGEVYSYRKGTEHYEIHTTLNSEKTKLSESMKNFWSFVKLREGFTYEFENEFHLCYLISHIEKHVYGSGAGVRMYLDIALFLNKYKDSLDFDKVREILRECQLEKFYDTVLYLCVRWFASNVKPVNEPDEKLYEEFCRYTLKGGVFGQQNKENNTHNEVRRAIGKQSKFLLILSHIFPPYREVRRMYPFFNGKPYLLPVGWVVHFFKASKRSGFKNIRTIASADMQKAKNENELLEKIGSKRY